MKLKLLVAVMGLITAGSAVAAGFTPPPAVVDRMELTRNHNGRFGDPNDWMRRITLSGEINVDGKYSNRSLNPISASQSKRTFTQFGEHHSSDIALADANLYLSARVNDWVMANLDLVAEQERYIGGSSSSVSSESSSTFASVRNGDHLRNDSSIHVDEAYVTIGNFHESPFYVLVGKEYVPYGFYNRHPITVPFTQLLTQTNATVAQLGFVDTSGINGSIFTFRNQFTPAHHTEDANDVGTRFSAKSEAVDDNANITELQSRQRVETVGAQIGYKYEQADMGLIADLSWLSNLAGVDYISSNASFNPYMKAVDGFSFDLMGHYQGFDGQFQYTKANKEFEHDGIFNVVFHGDTTEPLEHAAEGAKPSAWLAGVGYSFPVSGHNSRFGLNYQKSSQAVDVGFAGMPRQRWQADYMVNMFKNTDVTFEYVRDKDYNGEDGGTGEKSSTSIVRVATKFA